MTTPFYKEGNAMTTPLYEAANDQMMQDDGLVAENGQLGYPAGRRMARKPRTCASRSSTTAPSGPVSRIFPSKPEAPIAYRETRR
jgi:hypothetical protein